MKAQIIALRVEVPDRLHDPADMDWETMLKNLLGPIDTYAMREVKVEVLPGGAGPVEATDRKEREG